MRASKKGRLLLSRIAYLIELDPREVPQLAYVAGLLTGQGIPQGAALANALDRIQLVEVPDEFGGLEGAEQEGTEEVPESGVSDEGGEVIDFPTPVNDDGDELPSELPPIDPTSDPTAPENLGVVLNQPAPPPPPPPMNRQEDFGAGPPPREG